MLRKYIRVFFTITSLLTITNLIKAQHWNITGNKDVTETEFLGTIDTKPLSIKTKNTERLHIDAYGRIYSTAWWGLNAEPDQNYRLSVGGNIWSTGLTTESINTPVDKSLQFQTALSFQFNTNNQHRLTIGSGGQIYASDNTWWGLGVYPDQNYRLSVNGKISAENININSLNTEIINAKSGKDLIFKAADKEYIRIYKGGQGISIPTSVGIGEQPDATHKLYVNGSTFSNDLSTQNLNISNNVNMQTAKAKFAVNNDGRISLKSWVGINMEPQEGYALAATGSAYITDKLHIGQAPANKAAEYKVAVGGKIICEEVKVQLKKDWPDYVFDNSYNLMPLHEVEKYINQNKHLPDIPSAQQIQQQGVEVGDMQAMLLQKIEELTLHMIELKKENELLKQKIK